LSLCTWAALLAVSSTGILPRVVENPDPSLQRASIQAVVSLPSIGPRERAALEVVASLLFQDTETYGLRQMLALTRSVGEPLHASLAPDHLRIEIGIDPIDLRHGLGFLADALKGARFGEDAIRAKLEELPYRTADPWTIALSAEPRDYRMRVSDVVETYRRHFRPERTTIAVSGPFPAGAATSRVADLLNEWRPANAPPPRIENAAVLPSRRAGPIVALLDGGLADPSSLSFSADLLAAFAMGVGKASPLYEEFRERRGWSYRQELFLWPEPGGLRLRVAAGVRSSHPEFAPSARSALAERAGALKAEDRDRALALAEAVLIRDLPLSPLYVSRGGAPNADLHDRTFLLAYWLSKSGRPWSNEAVLDSMRAVDVEALRAAALRLVQPTSR
jgi:hypothetical protein